MDCICMGKLLKCHLKGNTCRKSANGQDIDYSAKKWTRAAHLLPLEGNIYVFYHNIQTFTSPKPLGQSKPNFI